MYCYAMSVVLIIHTMLFKILKTTWINPKRWLKLWKRKFFTVSPDSNGDLQDLRWTFSPDSYKFKPKILNNNNVYGHIIGLLVCANYAKLLMFCALYNGTCIMIDR